MSDTKEHIEQLKNEIAQASNIVCLAGIGLCIESGYPNRFSNDEAYRVEEIYGYSPEEIYSVTFYNTKNKLFFDYYRNEFLSRLDYKPSNAHYALKQLEDQGKLSSVITYTSDGLLKKAGIKSVVELLGSIHDNECPKCHRKYSAEFIRDYNGVPLCEECKRAIRPMVTLFGETMRNDYMTEAANACQNADMIIVAGINMNYPLVKSYLQYYKGDKVALITKNEHHTDEQAQLCIYGEVREILPKVVF